MRLIKWLIVLSVFVALALVGFLYAAPETATKYAIDMRRAQAGLERKEITTEAGDRFVYLEGGQGEPLLLLHGFGANKDNFTVIAKHLVKHYHVIAPDLIGFGESDHPQGANYSAIPQARRIRALVDALDLPVRHIGGSSMGGHISMTYAALYPAEVDSMWLIDPGGVWSAPAGELRQMIEETGVNPLIASNEEEFARVFDFVMSKPPFVPRPILNVMAQERIANIELEKIIFSQISQDSVEERIKGLTTAALIVWGDEDRAIHVDTVDVLTDLLPNSEAIIMKGIGHLPMLEAPAQSAKDYINFRNSL